MFVEQVFFFALFTCLFLKQLCQILPVSEKELFQIILLNMYTVILFGL